VQTKWLKSPLKKGVRMTAQEQREADALMQQELKKSFVMGARLALIIAPSLLILAICRRIANVV
jgi:hypothetical protein